MAGAAGRDAARAGCGVRATLAVIGLAALLALILVCMWLNPEPPALDD